VKTGQTRLVWRQVIKHESPALPIPFPATYLIPPNAPQEAQFQIIQCYYHKANVRAAYQQFSLSKDANHGERIRGVCEKLCPPIRPTGARLPCMPLKLSISSDPTVESARPHDFWERRRGTLHKRTITRGRKKYFQRIHALVSTMTNMPPGLFSTMRVLLLLTSLPARHGPAAAPTQLLHELSNDQMVPQGLFQVGVASLTKIIKKHGKR